ncbi:MAG: hypothetical protein OXF50_22020 [Caldilineaceae bacterium]|nr:hypothetical protein [Caldilineaceae bacterium]
MAVRLCAWLLYESSCPDVLAAGCSIFCGELRGKMGESARDLLAIGFSPALRNGTGHSEEDMRSEGEDGPSVQFQYVDV